MRGGHIEHIERTEVGDGWGTGTTMAIWLRTRRAPARTLES